MNTGLACRILKADKPTSELAVVVIARNEERHIGKCLEALMWALENYPSTPVFVVDSGSTDRTVEIASQYPVEIYRYSGPLYSAAAGRRIGFERTSSRYVLFLDGDCCIEPGWIEVALERLERDPAAAVIYGNRAEVFEGACASSAKTALAPDEYGLGGNALYRARALRGVGGFNPYLMAGEEGELLGRIIAAGYYPLSTPETMFIHYTLAKTSVKGFVERLRRGLARGLGQTLRISLSQGLFRYHARRLNRYLLTLAYLASGYISALATIVLGTSAPILVWVACGALGFICLWYRRRSVRSAAFIAADWVSIAVHLPVDFLRAPQRPEDFDPAVELLRPLPSHLNITQHL